MDFERKRPNVATRPGIRPGIGSWFRYFKAKLDLSHYLSIHSNVRERINFEIYDPFRKVGSTFLCYDFWPRAWKNRMATVLAAYRGGNALPMDYPLPLGPVHPTISGRLLYRSNDLARDIYIAQIAHVLWLELDELVPWRLHDYSDEQLVCLLDSTNFFLGEMISGQFWYTVTIGGSDSERATENILHDPRDAHAFLAAETEQQQCLIGDTAFDTCALLSGWFHNYLWHNPGDWDNGLFYREHPLLTDRLLRHEIPSGAQRYVTPSGCHSASSLFTDLMRSVNIPIRKVENGLPQTSSGSPLYHHSGMQFNWQDPVEARYLLHTDDLYWGPGIFCDPAPAPAGTPRGVALWNHVWLSPEEFESSFSYSDDPGFFGVATWEQVHKYREYRAWRMATWMKISHAFTYGFNGESVTSHLQSEYGWTDSEAQAAWESVEATVLSYGEGSPMAGYHALLLSPDSRHCQYCAFTEKCFYDTIDPCLA